MMRTINSKIWMARVVAPMVALALLTGFTARHARADAALDEGLDKLAAAVARFLADENKGNSVIVGDFIAPPRLQASGGRGLTEALAMAFQKHGIEARADAPMQVIGQFSLREETEGDNGFDSMALRVKAEVLDKQDEVLQTFNISIFGTAAVQIAGMTVDLPPRNLPQQDQAEIKQQLERPQAAIVGTETRASENSPYGIEVLVNRRPRAPESTGGRSFVPLETGEEYVVRLHNRSGLDAAVELTIDGLSMFAFSEEGNFGSQIIIAAGKSVEIPGWYQTGKRSAAFLITGYPESAAAKRNATTSIGTITATFAAAWDPALPPPKDEAAAKSGNAKATKLGRPLAKAYEPIQRRVGKPRAVVSVRYDR